jgi:hypothetical protein
LRSITSRILLLCCREFFGVRRESYALAFALQALSLGACVRFGYDEVPSEVSTPPVPDGEVPHGEDGGDDGGQQFLPEAGTNPDAASPDGGMDAGGDAGHDAGNDAGNDAGMDAASMPEAGMDAGQESGPPACAVPETRPITFPGVSGGPHTNFPVLLSITASWLVVATDVTEQGHVQSPTANDLYFTEASGDGVAQRFAHEIETYDGATGSLLAWVRVTSLSSAQPIYVHYGDCTVETTLELPAIVWDDYAGVWHLGDADDSSGNGTPLTGTSVTDRAQSKIGGGKTFDGSNSVLRGPAGTATLDDVFVQGATISAWVTPQSGGEQGLGMIASKLDINCPVATNCLTTPQNGWSLSIGDPPAGPFTADETMDFRYSWATQLGHWRSPDLVPSRISYGTNSWIWVVAQYTRTDTDAQASIFINGGAVATSRLIAPSGGIDSDANSTFAIGNWVNQQRAFHGSIDEVRLRRGRPSLQWLQTEYANQNAPGVFATVEPPLP